MTPGQASFKRWVELLDRPFPLGWNQLTPAGRAAWEDVAKAAIDQHYNNSKDAV